MVLSVFDLDPEILFPFFFDSYYYDIFTGNDTSNIFTDDTYETVKNNIVQQFGVGPNPYIYAIVPNRYTKSVIRNQCVNYIPTCIIAQVNTQKTEKKDTIPFKEISKVNMDKYLQFLRIQENSVKEGRWALPKKDENGKILYVVYYEDYDGFRSRSTTIPNKEVYFDEYDSLAGQTVSKKFMPYYRKSKAHPTSINYGYTLDLQGNKVQVTVASTTGNVLDSRWFLHQDYKGINTIAYGHVLLPDEIKNNTIQISDTEFVNDWVNKGLTDEEAFKLLLFDYKKHEKEVKSIIEAPRWNILPDMYRLALVDITYNGGGPRKFPKMCTAMGIPPKKGNITYFWPSIIDFKLGPVDHEKVKKEFKRPDVPNRDTAFKALFF